MLRKLTPTEFEKIRTERNIGAENFNTTFERKGGDIYLKDVAPTQDLEATQSELRRQLLETRPNLLTSKLKQIFENKFKPKQQALELTGRAAVSDVARSMKEAGLGGFVGGSDILGTAARRQAAAQIGQEDLQRRIGETITSVAEERQALQNELTKKLEFLTNDIKRQDDRKSESRQLAFGLAEQGVDMTPELDKLLGENLSKFEKEQWLALNKRSLERNRLEEQNTRSLIASRADKEDKIKDYLTKSQKDILIASGFSTNDINAINQNLDNGYTIDEIINSNNLNKQQSDILREAFNKNYLSQEDIENQAQSVIDNLNSYIKRQPELNPDGTVKKDDEGNVIYENILNASAIKNQDVFNAVVKKINEQQGLDTSDKETKSWLRKIGEFFVKPNSIIGKKIYD